jgi:RNA polymerase sigma factor (sigma-70 family)
MTMNLQPHRRALHVHCYRMLGSFTDADDLVQETMLRAWTARDSHDPATGELGLRRWLYRIATNACIDFLRSAPRRDTKFRAFKVDVMRIDGARVAEITTFDVRHLDAFGLPEVLP